MQKDKRKSCSKVLEELIALFPSAFSTDDIHVRPLHTNIAEDIIRDLALPRHYYAAIRRCLATYQNTDAYLAALAFANYKYDLYGNVVENVTSREQLFARQKLKMRGEWTDMQEKGFVTKSPQLTGLHFY